MSKTIARQSRLAVGLISGTSMDGIDAALVRLTGSAECSGVRLLAFTACPYPRAVRQRLMRIAAGEPTTTKEISELNFLLGEMFADAAFKVCRRGGISPKKLSVIGSHGQTIFHQGREESEARRPNRRRLNSPATGQPSTLQIAEPAVIAEKTGAPIVADFRTADIAAGGQGAPLVPMLDYLLLGDAHQGTVALNIGGIANFTVIPARARPEDVIGFDTGPGNMVIDGLVGEFTGGRKSYDAGGRLAAKGVVLHQKLDPIFRLPFFRRPPPKSAGREQFGAEFVKRYFLKAPRARPQDLLRTATELTARTIAYALERFVFPVVTVHRLIVSGGGAHNSLLMRRLAYFLPLLSVQSSDQFGLPVDAKEAIAFAVLADRTLHALPGNLPSVTGARKEMILGTLTLA
jgi:anhydro-N-acetylmuramic acid kinase